MTSTKYENNNTKQFKKSTQNSELSLTELERLGIEYSLNYQIEQEVNEIIQKNINENNRDNAYLKERRVRRINSTYGSITLEIPRFKKLAYFPSFLQPYSHNDDLIKEEVNQMLNRGLSTRNLEEVYSSLGLDNLSKSSLSRIHNLNNQEVDDFRSRRFDNIRFFNLMIDAFYVPVMLEGVHGHYCKDMAVVTVIGLNVETKHYEYLLIEAYPDEGKDCIRSAFKELLQRGLNPRTIVTSDSGTGITSGIMAELPFSTWNPCQFHEIKTCLDKLSRKDKEFREEVLEIYHAESLDKAWERLKALKEKYKPKGSYKAALHSIEKSLNKGTPYREIDNENLRKAVKTSNRLEGCNSQNRRRLDPVHVFWGKESLLNYLIRFALIQQERWSKKENDLSDCPIEEFYEQLQKKAQEVFEETDTLVRELLDEIPINLKDYKPDLVWINITTVPVIKDQSQYNVPVLQVFDEVEKKINLVFSQVLKDKHSSTIKKALLELKERGFKKKRKTLFILSGNETELVKLVGKLFKTKRIQFDREVFIQSLFNYIPATLRDEVQCFLDNIFSYKDYQKALELSETLCGYLEIHHLKKALIIFKEQLDGLLKIIQLKISLSKFKLSLKSFKPGTGCKCPKSKPLTEKPIPPRETFEYVFADWI